ncbi:MAG: TPM domain-containing protein [Methyloligellaceae bacterium]
MAFISKREHDKIARAIAAAEKKTSGEIVTVLARSSDDYIFIPLLWAALLALSVPFVMFALTSWPATQIYMLQLGLFAVCALAVQWRPLRIALIPRAVKRARAHRHAMEQVIARNLHSTKARTGVLIFVSVAERYAEVIADAGIYEKVPPAIWDDVVARLSADIARGEAAKGFIKAVKQCGTVLAEHFPPGSGDVDELPSRLIVLE